MVLVALSVAGYYFYIFSHNQHMNDNEDMRNKLSAEEYHVMYEKGTEKPFSSALNDEHRKGTYVTADTGLPVYRSEDKFDSGTGWPSFTKPIEENVELREDNSIFTKRIEVVSKDTGAHWGHVFDDLPATWPRQAGGPPPDGKRYCMNGVALRFVPDEEGTKNTDQ